MYRVLPWRQFSCSQQSWRPIERGKEERSEGTGKGRNGGQRDLFIQIHLSFGFSRSVLKYSNNLSFSLIYVCRSIRDQRMSNPKIRNAEPSFLLSRDPPASFLLLINNCICIKGRYSFSFFSSSFFPSQWTLFFYSFSCLLLQLSLIQK